jgi:predicted nucleic acid-binding protein
VGLPTPIIKLPLNSLRRLAAQGRTFCIGSQTISEFLAVATRSIADHGLGMTQVAADAELGKLIFALEILYDSAATIAELRRLVVTHSVIGKSVHDTRLVAALISHGLTEILTFNIRDFDGFAEIHVIDSSIGAKHEV